MNHKWLFILLIPILLTATILPIVILPVKGALIWSEARRLTVNPSYDIISSMTQTKDGSIWILWQTDRIGNFEIYYKVYSSASWSNDTRLTTNSNEDIAPFIIQLTNGTIWVIWSTDRMGNYDLFYKTSSNNGKTWSTETSLTNTTDLNNDYVPTALQTKDGKIWLVWQRDISLNDEIYYKIYDGTSWSSETPLITDPSLDKQPSIMQTSDGKIWVFWGSDRAGGGNFEIYYKVFDGSSWTTDTPLTADKNFDMDPTVFQALNGTIWVIWTSREQQPSGTNDLYYEISSDNGKTWSAPTQITPEDAYDDKWPYAIQTTDTNIWLTWSCNINDNFDIYYTLAVAGDVNNDRAITIEDMDLIAHALLTTPSSGGTPGDWWAWNPPCDLNNDGIVDGLDLAIAGKNYGTIAV